MSLCHTYYSHSTIRKLQRNLNANRNRRLINKNKNCRILVVLHLFYPESWKEIREYLLNFKEYSWDLYITFPPSVINSVIHEDILRINPDTVFLPSENKGYDIGPFLSALKQIDCTKYDVVFKLQSKGVHRSYIYIYQQLFLGRDWFLNLYEGIVGSDVIHSTIDRILNNPSVGMIGAENLIVHDPSSKEKLVIRRLQEHGLTMEPGYFFLAGTCFAIKPECLVPFQSLPFTPDDFVSVVSSRGISFAHSLERYLCLPAQQNGLKITGNEVMKIRRGFKRPVEKICHTISAERLLDLPIEIDSDYYLWRLDNRFIRYRFRNVPVGSLKYQMGPSEPILPLTETDAFRYLNGDRSSYEEYCRIHLERGYPVMSPERYDRLLDSIKKNGYDKRNIILINELGIIRDGQHRACCLAHQYGCDYKIEVLEIENIDRNFFIKHLIPRHLLRLYYKKRYNLSI